MLMHARARDLVYLSFCCIIRVHLNALRGKYINESITKSKVLLWYSFGTVLLVLVLVVSGCNDSSITEIADNSNDQIDQIAINQEPPELAAAFDNLLNEILKDEFDGVVDSAKVFEANRLAIELSSYHGPTKLIFELEKARAQGASTQGLKEIAFEHYGLNRLSQINNPCTERCARQLGIEVEIALVNYNNAPGDCFFIGLAGGLVGAATSAGNPVGAIGGFAGTFIGCAIGAYITRRNAFTAADLRFNACLEECYGPNSAIKN